MSDISPNTRLFQHLEKGEPVFGTYTYTAAPEIVEILGEVGFDYVIVDMMIQSINWESAARLVGAAYQYHVTPWLRVQSYPWSGSGRLDMRLPADVLRALSIGFQVIQVSVDGPEAIELALAARHDNHRRPYLPMYDQIAHSTADVAEQERQIAARTLIIPSIESERGLSKLDEILGLEGLRVIKMGMGDMLQVLGHRGDQNHPDVQKFIREVVGRAAERDVRVVVNMVSPHTPEEIYDLAKWLREAGVAIIEIPHFVRPITRFYQQTLGLARSLA